MRRKEEVREKRTEIANTEIDHEEKEETEEDVIIVEEMTRGNTNPSIRLRMEERKTTTKKNQEMVRVNHLKPGISRGKR